MQTANANPAITVTVRHEEITDSLRDYATKKIEGLHLDYPRIIEARAILDVQKKRHIAEIILFCANHITIEASTETENMYASIDETISKIARRMRKHKTRLLKKHRPKKGEGIKHLDEKIFAATVLDNHPVEEEEVAEDPEPMIIHRESYKLRKLYKEEAIMELELSDKPFLAYTNARRDVLQIVYRRGDGDYSIIEP
ncbi:ribosome-associated translation inhibitor RaiA [Persicirhabdus sediminis]|uniref:Ribosome hibernation promoting factor n=2 Tax=Persicirhabdus sediminis TaxID=454144 RepID=A0A8J7MC80_9BACT|nr:ribosome-associated translation inhibitor RaiA [Persicirhabdus sediminis]